MRLVDKAKAATMDRGHIEGMSNNEVEQLCNMIGLGGLKYYLLKVDPKKRMMFNPEESIELQGNTVSIHTICSCKNLLHSGKGIR